MNKTTEALKLAEEALDLAQGSHGVMLMSNPPHDAWAYRGVEHRINKALAAVREVLTEPVKQEPVAWRVTGPFEDIPFKDKSSAEAYRKGLNDGYGSDAYSVTPLCTAPPVVPQGEPVAWAFFYQDGDISDLFFETEQDGLKWLETEDCLWDGYIAPVYTTPPSVEAAIEATKEKAAKVCEQGTGNAVQTGILEVLLQERGRIAAAIRGLK
jgi:hypothetical protein